MKNPIAFSLGMFLCLLSVAGVYHWEYRYLIAENQSGAGELLVGAAIVTLYSSPIWCAFPILSMVFRKSLDRWQVALSFMPAVCIFLPVTLRVIGSAI